MRLGKIYTIYISRIYFAERSLVPVWMFATGQYIRYRGQSVCSKNLTIRAVCEVWQTAESPASPYEQKAMHWSAEARCRAFRYAFHINVAQCCDAGFLFGAPVRYSKS